MEGGEQGAGWYQGREDILMCCLDNQVALFRRRGWEGAGRRLAGLILVIPPAHVAHAQIGKCVGGRVVQKTSPHPAFSSQSPWGL